MIQAFRNFITRRTFAYKLRNKATSQNPNEKGEKEFDPDLLSNYPTYSIEEKDLL